MNWNELFPAGREPPMAKVDANIASPLWDAFKAFVQDTWGTTPRIEHSRCGGAPGWNVKYKARGRALCTVYPHEGFFACMVSVGSKEKPEAEALMAAADPYVRAVRAFGRRELRALAYVDVTSEDILRDAEALMLLRAAPKGAKA